MNTIYYANPRTGQRRAVKVTQKYQSVYHNRTRKLRPWMDEADRAMLREGFVRWPRKKSIPGFIEIRRAA